ncbi:MAG: hypothetical protein ABI351_03945 [Herbaspirillum sp.]
MRPKLSMTLLVLCSGIASAAPLFSVQSLGLPNIAAPSDAPVTHFSGDADHTAIQGSTPDSIWNTKLSYPSSDNSGLHAAYGMQLDTNLASGAQMQIGARSKEILFNTIYEPQSDLRIKFSGSQLSQTNDYAFASGTQSERTSQSLFLVGLRKLGQPGALFSEASLSAWHAAASEVDANPRFWQPEPGDTDNIYVDPRQLTVGAQQGYQWQLGLAPLPRIKLELGANVQHINYDLMDGSTDRQRSSARHIQYTHYLDDCTQLQGNFQTAESARGFGFSLTQGAWRISAAKLTDRNSGASDVTINAGYTISLGGKSNSDCGSRLNQARSFGSLASSATQRSANLPSAPSVLIDSSIAPVPSEVWRR